MWYYSIPPRSNELYHSGKMGMKWYKHKYGEYDERAKYAEFIAAPRTAVRDRAKKVAAHAPGVAAASRLATRNRNWSVAREQYNLHQVRSEKGEEAYKKAKNTREYAAGTARRLTKRLQRTDRQLKDIDRILEEETAALKSNDLKANKAIQDREINVARANARLAQAKQLVNTKSTEWQENVDRLQSKADAATVKVSAAKSRFDSRKGLDKLFIGGADLLKVAVHTISAKHTEQKLKDYMKKNVDKDLGSLLKESDQYMVDAAKAEADAPMHAANARKSEANITALKDAKTNLTAQRAAISEALEKTMKTTYNSPDELNSDVTKILNKALDVKVDARVTSTADSSKSVMFEQPTKISANKIRKAAGIETDDSSDDDNKKKGGNSDQKPKQDDNSGGGSPKPQGPDTPSGGNSPKPKGSNASSDGNSPKPKASNDSSDDRGPASDIKKTTATSFGGTAGLANASVSSIRHKLDILVSRVDSVQDAPADVQKEINHLRYELYKNI